MTTKQRSDASALLSSPRRLFFLVLAAVFLAEAAVMVALPMVVAGAEHLPAATIADALLLTLLVAPFLWWLIVRPLRSTAIREQARSVAIVSNAVDGIITINEHALVESFNPAAEQIFGYSEEEMLGQPLTALIPERYREAHRRGLERLRSTGESDAAGQTLEGHGLKKDGREFPLELSISTWKAGKERFFTGIVRDIAERKQAEEMQADFAAMIAHDLRSPLTATMSTATMLEDGLFGTVTEEQKKWLVKVQSNIRNLVDLVNDFLDLSKLEAGHLALATENVDFDALVQNHLDYYLALANNKNISLKNRVDPALPQIRADSRRLDQLLSNLMSNAIKFTGEGGTIEVGAVQQNWSEIRIWIKDTGIGIPPEEIPQLFQKYKQTTSGKTSEQKGTGLGLVICKMIVEAHGGKISVESQPGKGSTFTISLKSGNSQ